MISLLKYGTLLTMWLTWVFSLVDLSCNLRNGISRSKPSNDLLVFEELWCGNNVSLAETMKRCLWEVASGHIWSSMWVTHFTLARKSLVSRSILLVAFTSTIVYDSIWNSQNIDLLNLLAFYKVGNMNFCLVLVRPDIFYSNFIVKGILNIVMDNLELKDARKILRRNEEITQTNNSALMLYSSKITELEQANAIHNVKIVNLLLL